MNLSTDQLAMLVAGGGQLEVSAQYVARFDPTGGKDVEEDPTGH